jgi:CBS domain containing-hemolysin-like protein
MAEILFAFGIIFLLIAINGLFVAAEFAIIGVRPSRVEQLAQSGNQTAIGIRDTVKEAPRRDRYIATAQLGITLASLGLGMYGEPAIAHLLEEPLHAWFGLEGDIVHTITFIIALSLMTYLHVVVGEMIPKSLALQNAEGVVLALAFPMRLSQWLFHYAISFLNGVGLLTLKLLRVPPPLEGSRLHTSDELEMIISESYQGGLLEQGEQQLLANIFTFGERRVGQVMTPRPKMVAVPIDVSYDALRDLFMNSSYSRLPVYERTTDNIIGVIHLKDLVRHEVNGEGAFNLRARMRRNVPTVPETLSIETLLQLLKRQRVHMAIVIDEYGGTAGLVTLEDLVEEVVGEVRDEFDFDEIAPLTVISEGVLSVSGDYLLDDLDDYIKLGEIEYDVETVGGLILAELDRPPQVGDTVTYHDVTFTVESIAGRAVERVKVEFSEKSES